MVKLILLSLEILLLTGCVAGQEIALHYNPSAANPQSAINGNGQPVSVTVVDARPFIVNHDKDPSYIGHYRGSYGNTWDVTNLNEYPLADQMAGDISNELKTLGYTVVGKGDGKAILVTITNFNFDAMVNGRVWHDLTVKVTDNGRTLAQSQVKDTAVISGNFWVGAKYDMEREIPELYDLIIRSLIRANPSTMGALN